MTRKHRPRILLAALLSLSATTGCSVDSDSPPAAASYISEARDHLDAGDLDAAVIAAKNAVQQEPNNPEARYLLGSIYVQAGMGAPAEMAIRRSMELGLRGIEPLLAESLLQQQKYDALLEEIQPKGEMTAKTQARLLAMRGEAFRHKGDTEIASRFFDQALMLEPREVLASFGHARIELAAGAVESARNKVNEVIERDSANASAWGLLAIIEKERGEPDAAEEAFGKAIEHAPRDLKFLLGRALIRIDGNDLAAAEQDVAAADKIVPDHASIAYVKGLLSYRRGDFQTATRHLTAAQNSQAFAQPALFYLGASAAAQGHDEQAIDHLVRFVHAQPDSESASRLLARAYINLGDPRKAEGLLLPLLRKSPDDPELLDLMSRVRLAQGNQAKANVYLRKLALIQPGSLDAQTRLGVSLIRQDDKSVDEGVQELEQVLEKEPTALLAEIGIVIGHIRKGDYQNAVETARNVTDKHPENPAPWTLMGIAQGALQDYDQARSSFAYALALKPGYPSAAANLAALAIRDGMLDEARGYHLQTLEHYPDKLDTLIKLGRIEAAAGNIERYRDLLERAIAAHPDAREPRLLLAAYYLAEAKPLKGISVLRQVEATHGDQSQFLSILGSLQLLAGERISAADSFLRRTQVAPRSAEAHYQLANAYSATGNAEGFEQALLRALQLQPRSDAAKPLVISYLRRSEDVAERRQRIDKLKQIISGDHPALLAFDGQAAMEMGDFSAAANLYERAAGLYPDEGRWTIGISQAQLALGQQEEALDTLSRWIQRHPQAPNPRFVLANTYLNLERFEEAQAIFSELAKLAPDSPLVLNNLAWLMRSKDPVKALEYAGRAVELSGGIQPDALDTLATILIDTGDAEQGVNLFKKALEKKPDDPDLRYGFAIVLEKAGQSDAARRELSSVLSMEGNFPDRNAAKAMHQRLDAEESGIR